ncbi:MAG: DUF3105 domain-containing protein [Anaerolineae bacterium]|nr:DUF3105 domain-containing protein [Anaerolineae bacterium]
MYKKTPMKRQAKPETTITRYQTPLIIGGVVLGVILLVVLLALSLRPEANQVGVAGIEGVQRTTGLIANQHVDNPVYPDTGLPPPGGVHAPAWQNCGIYRQPIEARFAIHSLEHGAVWVTYDQDAFSEDQVAQLESLTRRLGRGYVLLSPYPNQAAPLALTAWGLQLTVDSPDDVRVEQFLQAYVRGPQTPEPGASCSGGIGNPIT